MNTVTINIDLEDAHQYSSCNKKELKKSKICGCFYCLKIFEPNLIVDWVNEKKTTAICPFCGIDSIIGDKTGLPINDIFLKAMKERWFAVGAVFNPNRKEKYLTIAELFDGLADDHVAKTFADDYKRYNRKWWVRFDKWLYLKILKIKIWWNDFRYPQDKIPYGRHCYQASGVMVPGQKCVKICPYWQLRQDKPDKRNGYCKKLGRGDWEVRIIGNKSCDSLLWDRVKQCGINV